MWRDRFRYCSRWYGWRGRWGVRFALSTRALIDIADYFGWDNEKEIRELGEALRKSPQSGGPSYWLGLIHGVLGRMEEGLAHARRAAKLEPLSPVVLAGVGSQLKASQALPYAVHGHRYANDASRGNQDQVG